MPFSFICEYCKKEFFTHKRKHRKYCSHACTNKGKEIFTKLNCEFCKKDFTIRGHNKKFRRFCSKSCQIGSRKTIPTLKCDYCSGNYKPVSVSVASKTRFCSKTCYAKSTARISERDGETFKTCSKCEIEKPITEFFKDGSKMLGYSGRCKTCKAEYNRETITNQEDKRLERALKVKQHYRDNIERYQQRHKSRRYKLRKEVLNEYGHKCTCCGEQEFEFLCIDHIFNNGKEERKVWGTGIYRLIKLLGFPKDRYQILCHNCNQAKQIYGVCPHRATTLSINSAAP